MPREDRNRKLKSKMNKPFASIFIDPDEKQVLGEEDID